MIDFVAALAFGTSQAVAPAPPPDCGQEQRCVQANAAQMFALADRLYQAGDAGAAADILRALTQDKHPELRAEARFRLAALQEKQGDLAGAAQALRELLAEQPSANRARLELARILSLMGDAKGAKAQIALAEAAGLPAEVEQNVRRFTSGLRSPRRRGLTIEVTAGPDSNINRSTTSPFVDTIIAPFELDADARRQSGVGSTFSIRGYSRDRIGELTLLSNAGLRADLFDKARFNDIQFVVDSGPEFRVGGTRIRPAAVHERRWYGGDPYSRGTGGQVELVAPFKSQAALGLSASRVRQTVAKNSGQDGWRTSLSADVTRALGADTTARLSFRYGSLDARVNPESLRQIGGGLLLARQWPAATLFGEANYTRTHGIEPIFLFGKTRHDRRWDFTAGAILHRLKYGGFSPLIRLTRSDSRANIQLYDYRRTRLDVGVTRSF